MSSESNRNSSINGKTRKRKYCYSPSRRLEHQYGYTENDLVKITNTEAQLKEQCCLCTEGDKNKKITKIGRFETLIRQENFEPSDSTEYFADISKPSIDYLPSQHDVNLRNGLQEKKFSPITSAMLNEFARNSSVKKLNMPRTPEPSNIDVSNKNLFFEQLPSNPENIQFSETQVVKQYLTAIDDFDYSKQEIPQLSKRNQSEVNDLLKTVYFTTIYDFPLTPSCQSMEKLGSQAEINNPSNLYSTKQQKISSFSGQLRAKLTDINNMSTNNYQNLPKDCINNCFQQDIKCLNAEKERPVKESKNECNPNNCDKLNDFKLWKSCCKNKLCPINDPSSSTYNFLLKVKMCCMTKGCRLAAKICDIYEPLVEVNTDFEDTGEEQYHYLSTDVGIETIYENEVLDEAGIPEKIIEEDSELEVVMSDPAKEIEDNDDEDYTPPDDYLYGNRRSTVSWSVPKKQGSDSQELLVNRATAEADKFRQVPGSKRQDSVFGGVVRQQIEEPKEFLNPEGSAETFEKSRIDMIERIDSKHKHGCCSSLKAKLKKRKKNTPHENMVSKWSSQDVGKRKANLGTDPVHEKKAEIDSMLNKM